MSYFDDHEAIEVWKLKLAGVGPSEIAIRMKRNPFRVYEVLSEKRNLGTRVLALEEFMAENPKAIVNASPHVETRRVIRTGARRNGQIELF